MIEGFSSTRDEDSEMEVACGGDPGIFEGAGKPYCQDIMLFSEVLGHFPAIFYIFLPEGREGVKGEFLLSTMIFPKGTEQAFLLYPPPLGYHRV